MSDGQALFAVLRQSADADTVTAMERLVGTAPDADLCRVNVFDFARRHNVGEEETIGAFLHAARIGLFEMSWNVLCPGCGGVLDLERFAEERAVRGVRLRTLRCRL